MLQIQVCQVTENNRDLARQIHYIVFAQTRIIVFSQTRMIVFSQTQMIRVCTMVKIFAVNPKYLYISILSIYGVLATDTP